MKNLIFTLQDMNDRFGYGTLKSVKIDVLESFKGKSETIIGKATLSYGHQEDERFFKVENGYVIFLSHKRKLDTAI